MKQKIRGDFAHIRLTRDFNLLTVRELERSYKDCERFEFDLSSCRFIDSEAIIYIHRLIHSGIEVRLLHPPPILKECLRILELEQVWENNENLNMVD